MEPWNETQEYLEKNWGEDERNIITALIVTILFGAIFFITLQKLGITGNSLIVLLILEASFYISIMLMLLEPKLFKKVTKTVEKPVYFDRIVEKPIEVIKEVRVPVVKEVKAPEKKKLNIPRYKYLGSTETETYHTRNCRLGKLIKKKYKLSNDSETFFKIKGFKPCKMCIQKLRKS